MKRAWRRDILLFCSIFLAFPIQASAYRAPDVVRVGLESVCKNASSALIDEGMILIGMEEDGSFEEGGKVTENRGFTVKPASGD